VQLLEGMSAFADNQRGQLEFAGLVERYIILPEMHAVSAGGNCDIDPVIYYAQHAGIFTNFGEFEGKRKKFIVVNGLCPQLNAIGAAGEAAMS
jgi:hypothetical protein